MSSSVDAEQVIARLAEQIGGLTVELAKRDVALTAAYDLIAELQSEEVKP